MNSALAIVVVFAVAGVIAVLVQRRRPAPPTQPTVYPVPTMLDRGDFTRPDAAWLVAVFTSDTCASCERVRDKARVLEASDVAYHEVSYQADRALHDRYSVEAVPLVAIADSEGVVVKAFVGEVTAIDLWGAVATARDPSSEPSGHHDHSP